MVILVTDLDEILNRCRQCSEFERAAEDNLHTFLYCRMPGYVAAYDLRDKRTAASVSVCNFYEPKKVAAARKSAQSLLFDVEDLPRGSFWERREGHEGA